MFCFNRKRILSRKEILSVTKLPPEELREVLEQIARQRSAHGWEFMLPTDVNFLYKYQELTEEETLKWKERYKELVVELNIPEEQHGLFKDDELPGLSAHTHQKPQSHRRRRLSKSISDDGTVKKSSGKRRSRTLSQSSQSAQESDVDMPSVPVKKEKDTPQSSPTPKRSPLKFSSDSEPEKTRRDNSHKPQLNPNSDRSSNQNVNGINDVNKESKAARNITKGIFESPVREDVTRKDNENNVKDKNHKQMNTTAQNHMEPNNCKFELDPSDASDVTMEDISVDGVEVNVSSQGTENDAESDSSVDSK